MRFQEEQTVYHLQNTMEAQQLFGPNDAYLKLIEQSTDAKIVARSDEVRIQGHPDDIRVLRSLFDVLTRLLRKDVRLTERDVLYAIQLARDGLEEELLEIYDEEIAANAKGKVIRVKTLGQRHYISAIKKHDVVFGIGPAGTGKTYLAVVMAVAALKKNQIKRIVLTRPAVEAGENLGFLPGDLQEKVDPYLRPLYDALHDMLGAEQVARLMERQTIEIAPLAYMRGRTLDDSFIILDEAQNTTTEQMKMFLTRLGFGSKMIITGDITQIDLPRGSHSGLKEAKRILSGIKGISFVELTETDVVRHRLVQEIIRAYQDHEDGEGQNN